MLGASHVSSPPLYTWGMFGLAYCRYVAGAESLCSSFERKINPLRLVRLQAKLPTHRCCFLSLSVDKQWENIICLWEGASSHQKTSEGKGEEEQREQQGCNLRSGGPGKVVLSNWLQGTEQDFPKPCLHHASSAWHLMSWKAGTSVTKDWTKKLKCYCLMNTVIIHTEAEYWSMGHASVSRSLQPFLTVLSAYM